MNMSVLYYQIDLKRTDLSEINFEYYGIASGYKNPTAFDLYVTNTPDDEGSWKRLMSLTQGFDVS